MAPQLPYTLESQLVLLQSATAVLVVQLGVEKLVVRLVGLSLREPWALPISSLPVLAVKPKNWEQGQPPSR